MVPPEVSVSVRVALASLPPVPSSLATAGCQLMSWKLPTTAQTLSAGALISTVSVTFWRDGP